MQLKQLLEKGFPKEKLALIVTATFPFELICPIIVGRMMSAGNPLSPVRWQLCAPASLLFPLIRRSQCLGGSAVAHGLPHADCSHIGWRFAGFSFPFW